MSRAQLRPARAFRSAPVLLALPALLALAAFAGCGGDSGTGPTPGSGPMSATIDGEAWAADENLATATAVPGVPGAFIVQGSRVLSGSDALTLQISVYNAPGPGTYPLGAGPTVTGGIATVATAGAAWTTPLSGAAGTMVISALTSTRIAGTFEYTADASVGSATGTRAITSGQFDLPLANAQDPLPALPGNAGGFFRADVGGTAYNASTVAANTISSNLIISSIAGARWVSLTLQSVTAPGDYVLSLGSPSRSMAVLENDGSVQWGAGPGMTGTVSVTSLTAQRAIGSFTATLAPVAGTASTLTISGSFDVGLP